MREFAGARARSTTRRTPLFFIRSPTPCLGYAETLKLACEVTSGAYRRQSQLRLLISPSTLMPATSLQQCSGRARRLRVPPAPPPVVGTIALPTGIDKDDRNVLCGAAEHEPWWRRRRPVLSSCTLSMSSSSQYVGVHNLHRRRVPQIVQRPVGTKLPFTRFSIRRVAPWVSGRGFPRILLQSGSLEASLRMRRYRLRPRQCLERERDHMTLARALRDVARPRMAIGTYGAINTAELEPGKWHARTR